MQTTHQKLTELTHDLAAIASVRIRLRRPGIPLNIQSMNANGDLQLLKLRGTISPSLCPNRA